MDLKTLPNDIYYILSEDVDHIVSEDNLNDLAENIKELFRHRLRKQERRQGLRFSSLGRPDRQIWMDAHPVEGSAEKMLPKTQLKFLYGDLIEQMLLFLCKEAGHTVEMEQAEVDCDGVKGHIDAIIDGVVVDVKSASPYGYKKFENGLVLQDDPFGYVAQLAGYSDRLTEGRDAAWLALEKVAADICVTPLPATVIKHHNPKERIDHLRKVIEDDVPPQLCYQPVPDGKSGNLKLDTGCSYCRHKYRCFPGLRGYAYSTGPRYLAKVVRVPDVPEISNVTEDNGSED